MMINTLLYIINITFLFALFLSYGAPYFSPDTILWPIAFLGLVYPLLLLINGLFLVYWLIVFKKHFWTNLIILAIGFGYIKNNVNFNKSENLEGQRFSIMSFNVRLFNAYNWIKDDDTKNNIINFINNTSSGIVCFQEFYAPEKLPQFNYNYSHIGLQNDRKSWRMATFSKYPIIKKGTVSVNGETKNNVCIYSDIVIELDTIRVYNIHLASNWFQKQDYEFLDNPSVEGAENIIERLKRSYHKRANQVVAIKKHINTSVFPVIVCGDFNDTPNSYAYKVLSEGLLDSFTNSGQGLGSTYNGKVPGLRIDYILHSPDLEIVNFKVHDKNLSDHFPIQSGFN